MSVDTDRAREPEASDASAEEGVMSTQPRSGTGPGIVDGRLARWCRSLRNLTVAIVGTVFSAVGGNGIKPENSP